MNEELLINASREAMERAYCPYSNFRVGAALLTNNGSIITGGNVENASYGATICAERSAIVRAIAEGYQQFKAIAICTNLKEPASPCGICRQFLAEFGDMQVIMVSSTSNKLAKSLLKDLLPMPFASDCLLTQYLAQ
ncbi:unnamed protein product [Dracunculus medinensis]|uniref:Cytidine deaminase n=1 Tax=Dracunculus medinensis TaxID=318479 RepID=A0A0N4UEV1_DRAME|nr:unnamed protein product [Dracunculus medinensis]